MTLHKTEALTTVRREAADSRTIVGIAVPYGVTSLPTAQLDGTNAREAFGPGAFTADVERWSNRKDGGRMAYRGTHGERPNGVVTMLRDSAEGVHFAADIFAGDAGDQYLREVDAGLNGVSIEWGPADKPSRKLRDGTLLHREARLHAIAGSVQPAYDGARIALRDMTEDDTVTDTTADDAASASRAASSPEQDAHKTEATSQLPAMTQQERSAAETGSVANRGLSPSITRAEAIYGPRSGHSFFADKLHASEGDGEALERQRRHGQLLTDQAALLERAGDVLSSEIPGAYPNQYLPGLLTPRILKGRPMGGFFQRFPITDAQPKIFPKVTTSTTVAVQSAEGANPAASDLATTAVTATPLLYGGSTDVSRQVLDGADPSIDQMLMQDLLEAYAQASETVIKTAVEAGSTASGVAITAATPYAGMLGNVIAYQSNRFSPAEGQFIPSALYAVALAQADTTGRALLPWLGATNSDGTTAAGAAGANLLGANVMLSWASTANVVVTGRPNDFVIFESSIATFRYDQIVGPAAIRIGIWAYLVVGARLGSLKVTAA